MTAHALPEVTKAITEQAGRILHSSTLYLDRPMVDLAERVAHLSGIPDARVFFTTSGTEANDTALLLATTYRRSNQILAMRNSYHGRSFSTVGITGQPQLVADQHLPAADAVRARRRPDPRPFAGLSTPSSSRRASPTSRGHARPGTAATSRR
jgi:4-aminobutyrate aminotransferase